MSSCSSSTTAIFQTSSMRSLQHIPLATRIGSMTKTRSNRTQGSFGCYLSGSANSLADPCWLGWRSSGAPQPSAAHSRGTAGARPNVCTAPWCSRASRLTLPFHGPSVDRGRMVSRRQGPDRLKYVRLKRPPKPRPQFVSPSSLRLSVSGRSLLG